MSKEYLTFEDWFAEQEGFSVRAERFDGDVAWLKSAFEAGRSKPVAGFEVQPLEWDGNIGRAGTTFRYVIAEPDRTIGWRVWIGIGDQSPSFFLTAKPENREAAVSFAEADYRQRILSTLSLPAQEPEEARVLYRHQKRGTFYELIGIGKMQSENWESVEFSQSLGCNVGYTVDMEEVAVYRSVEDPNEIWVRPRGEFEDGRFAAQALSEGEQNG